MEEDEDAMVTVEWIWSGYEMFRRRGEPLDRVKGVVVVVDVEVGGRKLGMQRRARRVIVAWR